MGRPKDMSVVMGHDGLGRPARLDRPAADAQGNGRSVAGHRGEGSLQGRSLGGAGRIVVQRFVLWLA